MQSICGEIFFLFFKIDGWFTLEWWGNKCVPAECSREALICFIDSGHFCEMFSMYFLFSYKTCLQKVLALVLLQSPGEQSRKESLRFVNNSFVREPFLQWKPVPHVWLGTGITPVLSSLVRFSCRLKIWMKETFSLPGRTCSSLLRKKCGVSWVMSFMQKMLAFKNNPLACTSLFLYQRIKNLFFENKIMVILLWLEKNLYLLKGVFKEHSVIKENTWSGMLRGKWIVHTLRKMYICLCMESRADFGVKKIIIF